MTLKPIKPAPGALIPTARELWGASREKLTEASFSINMMEKATDRVQYEQAWSNFVDAIQEFWVRFFDEGKKKFSNFQPWAGRNYPKRDPLIKYLVEARNLSQHSVLHLKWEAPRLELAPGFSGHIKRIKFYPNGMQDIDSTPAHASVSDAEFVYAKSTPSLPSIINNHGQNILPPTSHLEKSLDDQSPVTVAKIGLNFYIDIHNKAIDIFLKNSSK